MTACRQPGCTGTIVDGYCDVCGSPPGAAPFVPAAASAAAPIRADEPCLTAGRQEPGFPPKPKSGIFMAACRQPGCTGTIVDGYCDVCGSPADAAPLIPVAATGSHGSPAHTDASNPTAVRRKMGLPADPRSEGLNTACTHSGCTGMIVDGYCDVSGSPAGAAPYVPAAASAASSAPADEPGATVVRASTPAPAPNGREKFAEGEPDGAQDYRTRV